MKYYCIIILHDKFEIKFDILEFFEIICRYYMIKFAIKMDILVCIK
jgi:hypothetical protein